jgi:hypothetical protein
MKNQNLSLFDQLLDFFATHSLATISVIAMVLVGTLLMLWGMREIATWLTKSGQVLAEIKKVETRLSIMESRLEKLNRSIEGLNGASQPNPINSVNFATLPSFEAVKPATPTKKMEFITDNETKQGLFKLEN